MSDLESRIRTLLEEDATRAPLVAGPPRRLRQRVRGRQAGTGFLAAITGVVLVTASIAGIRALSAPDIDGLPAEQRYEIFERTADVASVTITSPSDWFLIDQAHQLSRDPEPGTVLPILQLSNFDPGLDEPLCGAELPSRGVALTIATEPYAVDLGPQDQRWPTALVDVESSDCGPGKVARFFASVGESSPTYFLWVGFGAEVSDGDRDTALRTVASLKVALEKRPLYGDGPAYVVAGGVDGRMPWLLELSPSTGNVDLRLETPDGNSGYGDFTVPTLPLEGNAFGAVTKEAARVEFRPTDGGEPVAAKIVPLPPSMPFDFDIFYFEDPFAVMKAEGLTEAIADDGTVLDRSATIPEPGIPPSVGADERRAVDGASGSNDWYSWWTTVQRQDRDAWLFTVSVADRGERRQDAETVWAGSVPASPQAMDGRSLNVVVVDMSERAPGASVLIFAFIPAGTEHVAVEFSDDRTGGQIRSTREGALPGRFVSLTPLGTSVGLFGNSYEGTGVSSPASIQALDGNIEVVLEAHVDWR